MSRVGLNARLSGAWHYIIGADAKLADRVNSRLAYPFPRPVDLFLSPHKRPVSLDTTIPAQLVCYTPSNQKVCVPGNLDDVCQSWDMLKNVGEKAAQVANGSGSWRLEAARDGRMWM